jgi:hypothetical protein
VPEQLCRFVASEWPGCPHEALRAWELACADWLAADSARAPLPGADEGAGRWWLTGWSNRSLPFGEFGDVIDVLREAERYSRAMTPCPHEVRPAQHWADGSPA